MNWMLRAGGQMQIVENLSVILFGTISHHKKAAFFESKNKHEDRPQKKNGGEIHCVQS